MTRAAFSGSDRSFGNIDGTTCHDTPYLSFSHPHWLGEPPLVSRAHNSSISACVWQSMESEIASLNVNCGPPFSARNCTPASRNSTTRVVPPGPGVTFVIAEFGKIEV